MPDLHEHEFSVFNAARELPAAERTAFVNQTCAGDPVLQERVEELLRAGAAAADFMEKLPEAIGGAVERAQAAAEEPGDVIGHYKLLEKIGEGGCGTVYRAEQSEPVRREVAFKIIKLGMDTRNVIVRFDAERQTLALMEHPHIAKVFDAGATGTGRPYFVMELVRGVSITKYCDTNGLPMRERLDLFIQVCQAIQHAHQKGIIHRDIKPSNILVATIEGSAVPKIIDFGIAKATQGRLTEQTLFTAFEQLLGTPAYMSPEQAALSGTDIDTRSDIYSLGVLLYELLTGAPPFEVGALLQTGLDEIRRTICETEPERPSTKLSTMKAAELASVAAHRAAEPSKVIHLLRGDLDWIVMKCLEKDRQRRYEAVNGLAADLKRFLNNEPVTARPPSRLYRFQKLVSRNKIACAAIAGLIGALALGLAASVWLAVRASHAEKIAKEQMMESESIANVLLLVANSMDQKRDPHSGQVPTNIEGAVKKLEATLARQPAFLAQTEAAIGQNCFASGMYGEAIALQEKVRNYYVLTAGPKARETLTAMELLANSYFASGLEKDGIALLQKVLESEPSVTRSFLTLAAWQAWSGDEAGYEATRQKIIRQNFRDPGHANVIVRLYCIRPSSDTASLAKALNLAQEGFTREQISGQLNWQYLGVGEAQYRNGLYSEAEKSLLSAENAPTQYRQIPMTARAFRVMSVYRQGRVEEARMLAQDFEHQIRQPLAAGRGLSPDDSPAFRDSLICGLVWQEANAVLSGH